MTDKLTYTLYMGLRQFGIFMTEEQMAWLIEKMAARGVVLAERSE